eukprot:gnl/Dysnectes_brevis/915_a1016_3862.p1 GENE.gnl/Dysnectes_brevis/915_a1016_3862~~gnl/Dysnectes_brevis/915_a1016_3862.p1  ORF type:complete len:198 (-),score=15.21 gnl/Dysnectes_brevis/915_a1016_3862:60-596(-)
MGSQQSSITQVEIDEIVSTTHFNQKEIRRLWRRFKRLDKNKDGCLTADEFLAIPELQMNPLARRVISMFDSTGDDTINFRDFLKSLSVFSVRGSRQEKLRFAFRVYDLNSDGYISNEELFDTLKLVVADNLTDIQLQQVVDKTILEIDQDGDGRISFAEFSAALECNPELESKLTIKF